MREEIRKHIIEENRANEKLERLGIIQLGIDSHNNKVFKNSNGDLLYSKTSKELYEKYKMQNYTQLTLFD